jgi:hypothetical protein
MMKVRHVCDTQQVSSQCQHLITSPLSLQRRDLFHTRQHLQVIAVNSEHVDMVKYERKNCPCARHQRACGCGVIAPVIPHLGTTEVIGELHAPEEYPFFGTQLMDGSQSVWMCCNRRDYLVPTKILPTSPQHNCCTGCSIPACPCSLRIIKDSVGSASRGKDC